MSKGRFSGKLPDQLLAETPLEVIKQKASDVNDWVTLAAGQAMLAGSGVCLYLTAHTGNEKFAYVSTFTAIGGLAITSREVNNKNDK